MSTHKANDLVIDGDSVYQYVTQELGTDKDHVHFYGHSLGGAIAAQVKALHPESEGKYVGDRTFGSIFSLITEKCCIEKLGPLIKKITSSIVAMLVAYPVYYLGWEYDSELAIAKMKGKKCCIVHPNDWLIPEKASLAFLCQQKDVMLLDPKKFGPLTHFTPIENHKKSNQKYALNSVVEFLSDKPFKEVIW